MGLIKSSNFKKHLAQVQQNSSDYLKMLQDIKDKFGDNHNPRFKKYIEKALEQTKPVDSKNMESRPDQGSLARYNQHLSNIKNISKVANDQWEIAKKLYENHTEIKSIFRRISILDEQMRNYINNEQGVFYLDSDSSKLLNQFEQEYNDMLDKVQKSQSIIENGFDKVGGVEI